MIESFHVRDFPAMYIYSICSTNERVIPAASDGNGVVTGSCDQVVLVVEEGSEVVSPPACHTL